MRSLFAALSYLAMGVVLGYGLLLTVRGNPWLLIVGALWYLAALGRLGCVSGKSD